MTAQPDLLEEYRKRERKFLIKHDGNFPDELMSFYNKEIEAILKELQQLRSEKSLKDIEENIQYCPQCHKLLRVKNKKYIEEMAELQQWRKDFPKCVCGHYKHQHFPNDPHKNLFCGKCECYEFGEGEQ